MKNYVGNGLKPFHTTENIMLFMALFLMFWFIKRDSLIYVIGQSLPPQEAGLMAGILLGDKSGFENEFYENLKNSGLIHLVVVSGSNVMLLIGGLIEFLAPYLNRKRSIMVGLAVGWWYVFLVGWEIPVLRAMLLLSIMYLAQLIGRKYNLVRGLILSILIMVIGEVRVLTSVSFWLSITAFLGVITCKDKRLTTVWVSVWIMPIMAMIFGKISVISPITNALVLGMVEVLTLIGAIGTGVGMMVPVLGRGILWLSIPMLKYLAVVVELGGRVLPLQINFNWLMLVGYYLVLLYFILKNKSKINSNY
jgi:competence protein ComEC